MAKAVAVPEEKDDKLATVKGPFQKMSDFWGDTRSEMKKVSTPSRDEVQSTTIVVIVTVFIFAAFFAVVDYAVGHTIGKLLDALTKH